MLTAGEIMTKDVVTVKKETSIRELAEMFTVRKISSAPVVDAEGDLIGIVTETDLVEQDKSLHIPTVISLFDWVIYLESGKKFEKELKKMTGQTVGDIYTAEVDTVATTTPISTVADIMSPKPVTVTPEMPVAKIAALMAKMKVEFIEGCVSNKIDKKIAEATFENMESFAAYAFNKSHAADYGVIAVQTNAPGDLVNEEMRREIYANLGLTPV